MNLKTPLTIFFFFFGFSAYGQDTYIEILTGYNKAKLSFDWPVELTNNSIREDRVFNFSLGFVGQIYKGFYFRTELGSNSVKKIIQIEYSEPFGSQIINYRLHGWFERDQVYASFLPEYRFGNDHITIYTNIGYGRYRSIKNRFVSGYRSYIQGTLHIENASEINDIINSSEDSGAFLVNAGINLKVKNIGLSFNFGYNDISPTPKKTGFPGIGIRQWTFRTGISYLIRSGK